MSQGRVDDAEVFYRKVWKAYPANPAVLARLSDIQQRRQADALIQSAQNIVWISSYPKAGATWLRFLICGLMGWSIESSGDVDHYIPSIQGKEFGSRSEIACRHEVMLQTHRLYDASAPIFRGSRGAVYVLRNPFDVMLSNMNFLSIPIDEKQDFVRNFIRHRGTLKWSIFGFGDYVSNVRSWVAAGGDLPLHIVRYEDLFTNPIDSTRRLAKFLGVDDSGDALRKAYEGAAFDSMKMMEEREISIGQDGFFSVLKNKRSDPGFRFVNKGGVGRFFDELDQDVIALMHEAFGDIMDEVGYRIDVSEKRLFWKALRAGCEEWVTA